MAKKKKKRQPDADKRVYQVVIDYGQQSPTKEALIVAEDSDTVTKLVDAKLAEEWGGEVPGHKVEIEELTPDYIEATYLASVETESPFYGQVDWTGIPKRVVEILLPKTNLDHVAAEANIKLMRNGKPPVAIEASGIIEATGKQVKEILS